MNLTARNVPDLRAKMSRWAADMSIDGAQNWLTFWLSPENEDPASETPESMGSWIAKALRAQLPAAELFYVNKEMVELSRHAAESLPDYRLSPQDLPSEIGLMVYAEPPVAGTSGINHEAITVVSWGPGAGGIALHRWAPVKDDWAVTAGGKHRPLPPAPELDETLRSIFEPKLKHAAMPPSFNPTHGYHWLGLTPMPYSAMDGWPERVSTGNSNPQAEVMLERTIVATWLLMGQSITHHEMFLPDRGTRRRLAREQPNAEPTIRYIALRRAHTVSTTDTDQSHGRSYSHQWIVRGHWRRQWYPSRQDHRPVWISPHIAGPGDKPLLGGERVNVLRR